MHGDNRQPHDTPEEISHLPHDGQRNGSGGIDRKHGSRGASQRFVHADAERHELECHGYSPVQSLECNRLRERGTLVAQQPSKGQEHFNDGKRVKRGIESKCAPETRLVRVRESSDGQA
jgi:hypothetical protein